VRPALIKWSALLALAACDDGTAPRPPVDEAIRIAYVESGLPTLQIVQEGMTPSATTVQNATPFAAIDGGLVLAREGGLSLYYLDGSSITVPASTGGGVPGGATSPDGSRLAYARRSNTGAVYLHFIEIADGTHDSLLVSGRQDVPAAVQIVGRRPTWSASGDSLAFVMPNPIGVQLFLYEVASGRIEVFPVPVPVTTYALPIEGWPYWHADGSLHFVGWRKEDNAPTDTLVVMRVFPRERARHFEVVFAAHTDSLTLESATSYSFSPDGRTVALTLRADGRTGIFVMHQGEPLLAPVLYEASRTPGQSLLIP
jgi:Tol biopolymer transport system component